MLVVSNKKEDCLRLFTERFVMLDKHMGWG